MRRLVSARPAPAGSRALPQRRGKGHFLVPVVAGWGLSTWMLAQGCGPSFEAIQEGDLRFAHCDRLDLDPNIAPSHRLHCWREWRRVYTYGQTRDRVEYAQRRIAEVVSGDPDPPFELPDGSGRPASDAIPGAANPLRSPPPAVVPLEGGEAALADDAAPSDLGPACRSRCEAGRAACAPGCETQPRGCKDCEISLRVCLDNCRSAPP